MRPREWSPGLTGLMSLYQETQESSFSLQVSRETHVRVQKKSPINKPGRELLSESKCAQNGNKINFWCLKLSFCSILSWQATQTGTQHVFSWRQFHKLVKKKNGKIPPQVAPYCHAVHAPFLQCWRRQSISNPQEFWKAESMLLLPVGLVGKEIQRMNAKGLNSQA